MGRGLYVTFLTDLAVNDGHYTRGETLATSFSGVFCGCSDGDGTTSFFKHLIFLLLYSCTIIKPGSVAVFGDRCLPPHGTEVDLQSACVGRAWPICLEQACLSNKLTEWKELS